MCMMAVTRFPALSPKSSHVANSSFSLSVVNTCNREHKAASLIQQLCAVHDMATLRPGKVQPEVDVGADADAVNPTPTPITTLGNDGGILCLGVFRTGTYSMTKALNTLGVDRVLHGMDLRGNLGRDDPVSQQWARAAWQNMFFMRRVLYPSSSGVPPPAWLQKQFVSNTAPFTRADWDSVLGDYQSATDVASLHTASLLEAYPHAKVILCYRDPDRWAASVDDTVVKLLAGRMGTFVRRWAEPLSGTYIFTMLWDILRSWFEVETATEMRAVYKKRFEAHYAKVRAAVPPGQLLEYRLGDGWGPLCEFLGRPVPETPFPRVNEGKSLRRILRVIMAITLLRALWVIVRFPIMLVGFWVLARAGQNMYFGKNG